MLNPDNETLEWCAKWIEDSLSAETNERTIAFGKNMAMTIRAVKTDTRVPPAASGPQPVGSPNQVPVLRRGNKTFTEVEAVEVIRDTINDWESCDLKIKAQWLLEFYDAHAAHPAPPAGGPQPAVPLDAPKRAIEIVGNIHNYYDDERGELAWDAFSNLTRRIASALTTLPAASGPQTCVKCGHSAGVNSVGECRQCIDWQKHVCEFPAATTSAEPSISDEVQRRMDAVVEAAVEWHQAGREGAEWFDKAEALSNSIDHLLEMRSEQKENDAISK